MKKPVLFHDSLSYECQLVRLALAEKGVRWKGKPVSEARNADIKPPFLKRNRDGGLPLMEHDGIQLSDTLAICIYINNNFPGPRLVPTDAAGREAMETWIRLFQQFPEREVRVSALCKRRGRRARAHLVQRRKLMRSLAKRHPAFQDSYEKLSSELQKSLSFSADRKFIERMETRIGQMLDILEAGVQKTGWLAGPSLSLADICWATLLARLDYFGLKNLWTNGKRPKVDAYYEKLRRRGSFGKAHVVRSAPLLGLVRRLFVP